jgi:signal transduction histidine kinase
MTPRMTDSADLLYRWIFVLTAGLLFAAAALRSLLSLSGDALLTVLFLLLVWLALLIMESAITPRRPAFFHICTSAQTAIVVVLMARVYHGDFYFVLFGVMSMRATQRLGWKAAFLWVALFTPLTALALTFSYDDVAQVLAFAVLYAAVDVFLAAFTLVTRRAAEQQARNWTLLGELEAANREVEAYSRRVGRLAAGEERHRLARELHDSVTQTVFSMNLTAQSAALLLPRDRAAAVTQLVGLQDLARSALAEIRALGSELSADEVDEDGLVSALQRHLGERGLPDGLTVAFDVEGEEAQGSLSAAEEHALFRIVQEALNNTVKHAQAGGAAIRLRLSPPRRLEIVDDGRGFDVEATQNAGGLGLQGMRERAREIGWSFTVSSSPGAGVCIVVEKDRGGVDPTASDGRVGQ